MEKGNKNNSLLNKWKNRQKKSAPANVIEKAPNGINIPLSPGQKRLWFLQQLFPDNQFYNYAETYTFKGILNKEKLIESLKIVYNSHDILKTTYHGEGGEIFQKVNIKSEIPVPFYDLSSLDKKSKEEELNRLLASDAQKYFDITTPPLVRFSLIKMDTQLHILQITIHHIATDKWSMGIFRKNLASCYRALIAESNLPEIRSEIQYADYSFWLNQQPINEKQLSYWKTKLSGDIPQLKLPTDYDRPETPSYQGTVSNTEVYSIELSSAILNLSRELKVTPYVILISVFYIFLNRISKQDDIYIGTPIANRSQKVLENLIGFFNDTVVLKASINSHFSFSELVAQVQTITLEAFANKDIPFDVLVKSLGVPRSLSANPLFQVMFLYHSVPENPFFDDELELEHIWYDFKVAKFDLTLYISEENNILTSTFEYSTDLFKAETIKRLHGEFNELLERLISKPNIPIFEHLNSPNGAVVKTHFVHTDNKFLGFQGIHKIIESVAKKSPDAIALTFGEENLTYKELDEKANLIAMQLFQNGPKNNEIIGLCINRSLEMIVGMMGILKSGGAYLPIDPDYPEERINFILNDAKVNLIVAQNSTVHLFKNEAVLLVNIDENIPEIEHKSIILPESKETDLAYVIYTSGSTGKPKGVPITHKNIINSTQGRPDFYKHNPSAFLLMSSISFDSSKAGIFWTLCTGGNLVITEKRIEQDIDKICAIIDSKKITHTLLLPSLYNVILNFVDNEKLNSLNTVIVAGEACHKSLCKKHFELLPEVHLVNEYGPTEATVWCSAHKITKDDLNLDFISIGKPVANSEIFILDDELNGVPTGEIGEIFIGGKGLSPGYLNRKDLTEQAFIQHPMNPREKLYKTGDLAKFHDNGTIEFLGRKDQQIKIRGYRVELSEIENAIKTYSNSIDEAVVVLDDKTVIKNLSESDMVKFLKTIDATEVDKLINSIKKLSQEEKLKILNQAP